MKERHAALLRPLARFVRPLARFVPPRSPGLVLAYSAAATELGHKVRAQSRPPPRGLFGGDGNYAGRIEEVDAFNPPPGRSSKQARV